jgi:hypothetical protein
MLAPLQFPLADLGETLRVVMPIIFVVIYGVAHLVGALQQEKKKRAPLPRPEPGEADPNRPERIGADRLAGNPVDANRNKPATLEETLRREVEEFLKRAQGQPAAPPQSAKRPAGPQRQRPAQPQKPRPQQQRAEQSAEPVTRRLVNDPQSVTGRKQAEPAFEVTRSGLPAGAAVDAYVTEQMRGVASIAQHAQGLGEEVAQADDRMEAELKRKFDHRVGTLARSSASTISLQDAVPGSTAAREFREILARPGGMRQMIIANEILRRPDERW